ncbi:MAG: DUF2812 domain-containing protein [Eubacterium sp.]|nr:DUF2812 domain-containing protein [Eubacterium sp.]MDE6155323.1 DUF2812 domain-containing protein [Eubacterium sp.]MDE6767982.1 DUF2812 domain-containing protein [Eubacterium sp.]
MKDKKIMVRFFNIVQWRQEQDYLRAQHNMGWKFVKVNALGCYHFEKCEPEDVKYQLDYNPEGIAHKAEYIQMFSDCGWEYMQDYVGYSYFRKPVSEMQNKDEEIFCDDSSRLDMMNRVFKGRIVPLIILFFGVILPQLFMNSPVGYRDYSKVIYIFYLVCTAIYLIMFLSFAYQYWKYKKSL